MFAQHSVQPVKPNYVLRSSLIAIVYPNEHFPQSAFERIVEGCRRRNIQIAGVLQLPACNVNAGHCDVILEDLFSGKRTELFEDRGPGAKGCRLNVAALAEVNVQIEKSLDASPQLLLLNKFGKVEAEGGGLLDLVAKAMTRDIPVVIGVPMRNLDAWRSFAGDMSVELSNNSAQIDDWLSDRFDS